MPTPQDHDAYPASLFRPEAVAVPVVVRERLVSRLVGPSARKIALIAAPVGYGKTVLLAQAHSALVRQGRRCLWLSADKAGGGDLPDLLWAAADRAGLPAPCSVAVTLNGLLARIERIGEGVSIFIDGLEGATPLEDALWRLLRAAPPDIAFLVATGAEPRPSGVRLEASGLLRRIGASELAFDDADLAALGEADDLPGWAATLNARSEGWPAIVQLALCRFREHPDLAPLPVSGTQHDIAAFFERDVLRDLDADAFALLQDVSVADRICGSLLDALHGGANGAERLNALVGRGVPIQPSRSGEWFRLHPLLREYLYDRLQRRDAERLACLHRRTADWLLAFGDEQAALQHATASGDIDFLRTIYRRPSPAGWLSADPGLRPSTGTWPLQAPDESAGRPPGSLILDLIKAGQIDRAREAIADIQRQAPAATGWDVAPDPTMEWELTYIDLLMRVFDDRLPRPDQLESLRDRLMRTPGVPPPIPAAVSELLIVSRFRSGELSGVAGVGHDLWHTSALAPPQSRIYVLIELGITAIELGDLDVAVRHLCDARALAVQTLGPDAPHAHAASTLLAEVAFERGDHVGSARELDQSFPRIKREELWFNLAASAFTTRSAAAAQRSWDEALAALELPRALAANVGLWRLPPLLMALRLRLAVLWGQDMEAARDDRASLSSLGLLDLGELDSAGFGWRVAVPAQLAVIRFDLADGKAAAALARATALRPILEARNHIRRLIELNLLQGRALAALGDADAGLALVRAALRLSAESGMAQGFMDELRFLDSLTGDLLLAHDLSAKERVFLHRMLDRLAHPPVRPMRYVAGGRTFDLSSREAQLLRALASGKTFKEISFAMNISINTTKMHRTRLYRKLGCNSRSRAISLAQELVAG